MIKKTLICLTTFFALSALFSFNQEKKLKLEFTVDQANVIYEALGELPAKKSEAIRLYISSEYKKQFIDTIKTK